MGVYGQNGDTKTVTEMAVVKTPKQHLQF